MNRQSFLVAVAAVCATVALSAADVTFILKNGARHSGRLDYDGDATMELISGGATRSFPIDDIAVIVLSGHGDPAGTEVTQLPTSDNQPDRDRHTLVLNTGELVRGKFYDYRDEVLSFHTWNDAGVIDRRSIPIASVARLYLSNEGARHLFNVGAAVAQPEPAGQVVRVEATRPWTDTGITVQRGERIAFSVKGEIQIAPTTRVGPDGDLNSPGRRAYPVPSLHSGALVGRVGQGAPFPIGGRTDAIAMPVNGRLLLGINDDNFRDNRGAFEVTMTREKTTSAGTRR